MRDDELRKVLLDVMDELDAGRLVAKRRAGFLRGAVFPAVAAAALGLAGCEAQSVGTARDGEVAGFDEDARVTRDGWVDSGEGDAGTPDASDGGDAYVDPCPNCVYLAPPPVDG